MDPMHCTMYKSELRAETRGAGPLTFLPTPGAHGCHMQDMGCFSLYALGKEARPLPSLQKRACFDLFLPGT